MSEPCPSPGGETIFYIRRQKQVSWFDTRQLVATGSHALAASIVGSMSGRREIMAALEPEVGPPFDYGDETELWIDYVADTGDGWNATESVAWLVGRDGLVLNTDGSATPQPVPADCFTEGMPATGPGQKLLPAGRLLVLGGDEVYPTASPETYQHRFTDPFRCARWHQDPERHMFSIPGNHDWYDGLTSFIRLFCQSEHARRWFGAWQAQQRRSYYSLRLPHGWWLWGVDMALEDDLDPPQYDYFREQAKHLRSGDRLILSVPTPTWLKGAAAAGPGGTRRYVAGDKLDLIMKLAEVEGRDVDIPLILTGDLHYYVRHCVSLDRGDRHYIVCGGGGAFGRGTTRVGPIELCEKDGSAREGGLVSSFPDRHQSVQLRRGAIWFPFKNPAFTALLATFQLITLWLLSAAADPGGAGTAVLGSGGGAGAGDPSWITRLMAADMSFGDLCQVMRDAGIAALSAPALLLWLAVIILGFAAFANAGRPLELASWKAVTVGILHALLQIVGAFVCVWLAAQLIESLFGAGVLGQWATFAVAAVISYLYCGFLFGAYLWLAHKLMELHDQEVFSAQAIEDYKSFLRLRITAAGLEVYPIGLRRHVKLWKAAGGVSLETVRAGIFSKLQKVIVPPGCLRVVDPCDPIAPHFIEKPFVIPGATAR